MDVKQKEEIILNSLQGLESLNGEMHHPDGALFISAISVNGEKHKLISAVIGCKHGMINALVGTAQENKTVRDAIRKAAKILERMEKDEPEFPEFPEFPAELAALLGMKKDSHVKDMREMGKEMLMESARKFIDSMNTCSSEERKTVAKQFEDELGSPIFPRLKEESCYNYMVRVTGGDCPEIVLKAAKMVDEINLAAEPAS